jgi:hypothetical protein
LFTGLLKRFSKPVNNYAIPSPIKGKGNLLGGRP